MQISEGKTGEKRANSCSNNCNYLLSSAMFYRRIKFWQLSLNSIRWEKLNMIPECLWQDIVKGLSQVSDSFPLNYGYSLPYYLPLFQWMAIWQVVLASRWSSPFNCGSWNRPNYRLEDYFQAIVMVYFLQSLFLSRFGWAIRLCHLTVSQLDCYMLEKAFNSTST